MKGGIKDQKVWRDVLEKTEWVAIVTWDGNTPHLVATWGDYVRSLGIINDEIILIPAGHYNKTEENLKGNKHVKLLIASRQVKGSHGTGQGCVIEGEGEIQTEGEFAQRVKEKFSWARGAFVVRAKEVEVQL